MKTTRGLDGRASFRVAPDYQPRLTALDVSTNNSKRARGHRDRALRGSL